MRPRISEELTGEIEALVERHHYDSKSEFIRDALRRRVEELKRLEGP